MAKRNLLAAADMAKRHPKRARELGVDAEEALRGAALDDRDRIVAREREALDREEP